MFRLFFVTDIHGSDVCFKKFVKAAEIYKPNAMLLCGDLTGKFIVPIIKQQDGTFKARYAGSDLVLTKQDEVVALEQKIADTGSYSYEVDSAAARRSSRPNTVRKCSKKKSGNEHCLG